MLEFEVTDEIRLGRMLRFYMFDGFVRGLKAELEYLEGHPDALTRHFRAIQEIDYTEIFRDPPELDGETLLN